MRDGGGEPLRVLHQHLPQLLASYVGGPDEDDGSLVVSTWVVQAHLLVRQDLLRFFFAIGRPEAGLLLLFVEFSGAEEGSFSRNLIL